MGGRIRSIKPEILEDDVTAGLSDVAFRMFIGVILLADDAGGFRAGTDYLYAQIFWSAREGSPRAREDVARALAELETSRLVSTYSVRGQRYGSIRNWLKHQRIDKPSKPKIPLPSESDETEAREGSPRAREGSPRAPGGIGRDRKGSDQEIPNPPSPPPPKGGGTTIELANPEPRPRPRDPRLPSVDPLAFVDSLGRAAGSNFLPSIGMDASVATDLAAKLESLDAADAMPDPVLLGEFIAAGGLLGRVKVKPGAPWLVRQGALLWLVDAASEWDRSGRPELDERGKARHEAPRVTPETPRYNVVGSVNRKRMAEARAAEEARKLGEGTGG